jgi:hypothetical protein
MQNRMTFRKPVRPQFACGNRACRTHASGKQYEWRTPYSQNTFKGSKSKSESSKSGQYFFYTKDGAFMVKTQTPSEEKFLQN